MKLIVEAGGTKCRWGICNESGKSEFITKGFNPNFSEIGILKYIIENELISKSKIRTFDSIYYYGTGCSNPMNQQVIKEALSEYFISPEINVVSDLEGSAKAIFNEKEGLIAILGTGASAGYYNGKTLPCIAPSLGYLLGDEGSGAYLGKELIRRYLRNELDEELTFHFQNRINLNIPDIIKTIYTNPQVNSFLASYVDFLAMFQNHPVIKQMLTGAFLLFYEKHIKPLANLTSQNQIGIVGGVAWQFSNLITDLFLANYNAELIIKKEAFDELVK
jgi:glucosamine kinase